jgi:hypothetical protein
MTVRTRLLPDGRRSRDFTLTLLLSCVLTGLGRDHSVWGIGW